MKRILVHHAIYILLYEVFYTYMQLEMETQLSSNKMIPAVTPFSKQLLNGMPIRPDTLRESTCVGIAKSTCSSTVHSISKSVQKQTSGHDCVQANIDNPRKIANIIFACFFCVAEKNCWLVIRSLHPEKYQIECLNN